MQSYCVYILLRYRWWRQYISALSPISLAMHFSFIPCCISALSLISSISRLIYSASYLFRVSSLFDTLSVSCLELGPCLKFQIMSQLQATSRNHSCVTRIEIGDSWRNKIYIERAAHLVFCEVSHFSYHLSDQSHNFIHLMRFLLYLLAEPSIVMKVKLDKVMLWLIVITWFLFRELSIPKVTLLQYK